MIRKLSGLLLLLAALALPASAFGAEAFKARYITTVYTDDKGVSISQPGGLACTGDTLIVSDSGNDRLLVYGYKNENLTGGKEIKVSQMGYPFKVRRNSKGDLFVPDEKQHRILHLKPDGTFVEFLAPADLPDAQTMDPKGVALDAGDNIYILDIYSGRVVILNPDGKFRRQIEFPKDYGFMSDITVNTRGDILLLDSVKAVIYSAPKDSNTFSPLTKSMKEYMNFPVAMTTDTKGNIYVVDRTGGGIVMLGLDGSFKGRQLRLGWRTDEVYYPTDVCVNENGDMFVADRNNNRVQIYSTENP